MNKIQEYAIFDVGQSKKVEVFSFSSLPNDELPNTAFDLMGENGRDYGAYPYIIYGNEADYADYGPDAQRLAIENDEWFIAQGCYRGETVILLDDLKFNKI